MISFSRSVFQRFRDCLSSVSWHHKTSTSTTNSHNVNHHSPTPITPAELHSEFAHHHPSTARINNGSFGSCPASVIAAQHQWQLRYLQQPDNFVLNNLQPSILRTRSVIKDLVNADHLDEISIVDNATTAAATVLQHIAWSFHESRFNKGDAALILRHSYGAVKKSLRAYFTRAGGHVIEVNIPFPLKSETEIITQFQQALQNCKSNGTKIRLAVIDHITSMPSILIPVKELVKLCREQGVDRIFIDAAHAIGSAEVDVKDIGADFYTSNLHKWFFCPPSVAFLYCKKADNKSLPLHHPVVSHEYGNGLALESGWVGTRDYSAQLVVPSALEFVNRFEGGMDGIRKRNHEKVVEMGEMLVKSWGTNFGAPPEMCTSMAMVGLPEGLGIGSELDAFKFRKHLRDRFSVEVHIYYRAPEGESSEIDLITGYARISHQVYNKIEDYCRFRDAVNELVNRGFTCKDLSN
ncbi:hypothetical protein LguiA_028008 [Lonicera macranthoides]